MAPQSLTRQQLVELSVQSGRAHHASVERYLRALADGQAELPLGGASVLAAGTVAPRALADRFADFINVKDFGAVGDGVTDDTQAVVRAITAAYARGVRVVYFPPGEYWFAFNGEPINPGEGNITFVGAGKDSVLHWDEGSSITYGDFPNWKPLFYAPMTFVPGAALRGSFRFHNLHFRGTLFQPGGRLNTGGPAIVINYAEELVIDGCWFTSIAQMATQCEKINRVTATNNTFDTVMRDCLRFRTCFDLVVGFNQFKYCDDDAIALHQHEYWTTPGNIREGITIVGNVLEATSGIVVLGARATTITGNVLRRVRGGIRVDYSSAEAPNAIFGINVTNNVILDTVCLGVEWQAIFISGPEPVDNSTPGVATVQPYAARDNSANTTTSIPVAAGINVSNNTIMRTLPAVSNYSDWGFGQLLDDTGWTDPAISDAVMRAAVGVAVQASARGVIISNNNIRNTKIGVLLANDNSNNSSGASLLGNTIFDCSITGLYYDYGEMNSPLKVMGNTFDIDPYCIAANRNANGTWNDPSGVGDVTPRAITINNYNGVILEHNTFANCGTISAYGVAGSPAFTHGNTVVCQPVATGYNASNRGIATVPPGSKAFKHVIANCDPTSASYGDILNVCLDTSPGSQPSSGYYVTGHFTENTAPIVYSNKVALGWLRLTTGNGHVAGTDWVVCWASTVL